MSDRVTRYLTDVDPSGLMAEMRRLEPCAQQCARDAIAALLASETSALPKAVQPASLSGDPPHA